MAKISEMTDEVLAKYIQAYTKKVETGVDVIKNTKLLNSMNNELEKRKSSNSDVKPVIHHSSDIDYSSYANASFKARAIALLIDSIILGIGNEIFVSSITAIFKTSIPPEFKLFSLLVNILGMILLPTAYVLFFLRRNGQTLGKKLMKIKIINLDGSDNLTVGTIILRESIGKLISAIILYIGFIIVLFGKESWHDSIAKTKVIKIE
jgi:uncharacterized RDD family membrane protein YckC